MHQEEAWLTPSLFFERAAMGRMFTEEPQHALRMHRHDVLNQLQVIRAYIQLQRPSEAVQAIDRLAAWLRSFSMIQPVTPSAHEWLWAAMRCPHIVLSDFTGPGALTHDESQALARSWDWLEEQLCESARTTFVSVTIHQDVPETADLAMRLRLRLHPDPETVHWWTNVGQLRTDWPWIECTMDNNTTAHRGLAAGADMNGSPEG